MTIRDTGHNSGVLGSVESWLVSAGRDRRPGSPLNVPPCPASNFVLGERRARLGAHLRPLRQNFFRAGHAHAGVIVILSLVCQIFADGAVLPDPLLWFVRIGVPLSAILISAGFFFSMLPPTATQASGAVALIYTGAVILALAVVTLGVGLLRS